jgi:hypothetical protein
MANAGTRATDGMIDELVTRLNLTSSSETRILGWLNEYQDYIERLRSDWKFCIDYDNSLSTTDGTFAYDLPSDFMHFISVYYVTNDRILTEKSLEWVRTQDPTGAVEGDPEFYVMLGPTGTSNVEAVGFYPIPGTSSDSIKHDYYKRLPALTNSSSSYSLVPDHNLLMLMAEKRGRMDSEEPDDQRIIGMLDQEIASRLMSLIKYNTFSKKARGVRRHSHLTASNFGSIASA